MNYYIRILVDKKSYKNNSDDEVQKPIASLHMPAVYEDDESISTFRN